jgi:hypothetical protein
MHKILAPGILMCVDCGIGWLQAQLSSSTTLDFSSLRRTAHAKMN